MTEHGLSPRARKLIRAAADLFGSHGYACVGIDDIAAAVGVTGPSVYRHFDTKYDLLRRVHTDAASRLTRSIPAGGSATLHDVAEGAVTVRRSLGTLRRDREHLRSPDSELVATTLEAVADAVRTNSTTSSPGSTQVAAQSVLSAMSSIGTHRTALTSGAITGILGDAATRLVAVTLPAATDSSGRSFGIGAVGKREALLSSAATLFDTRDLTDVAVSDIAASVGLATSSVYRYYGSKTSMLGEICLGAARRTAESTAYALSDIGDPRTALTQLISARCADATRSPGLRVLRRHLHSTDAAVQRQLLHMGRQERAEWVRVLGLLDPLRGHLHSTFLVEAAFTVIDDLSRHLDEGRLTTLVEAVLG